MEILRDAFPALKRIAVLYTESRGGLSQVAAIRAAGALVMIEIMPALVPDDAALGTAIETAVRQGAEGFIPITGATFRSQRETMIALAALHRIPAIYSDPQTAVAGGLMAYGPDRLILTRRAAVYVDRILKGAKPADIPVEQDTRFEFAINLKTARELGLTIPPALIALADRVIE